MATLTAHAAGPALSPTNTSPIAAIVHLEHGVADGVLADFAFALRQAGRPTLPSRMDTERAINPFLRTREATVAQAARGFDAHVDPHEPATVLAALRQWKNEFR